MIHHLRLLRHWFAVSAMIMVAGCAGNSAITLMEASHSEDPVIPSRAVVTEKFASRAFQLQGVSFADPDYSADDLQNLTPQAIEALLKVNLDSCLAHAGLLAGSEPPLPLRISIDDIHLLTGSKIVPDLSLLKVRFELSELPDEEPLLRGHYETRYLKTMPFIFPGAVGILPLPSSTYEAIAKMFPAMAVAITATLHGLQQGMSLEEIPIYPDRVSSGGVIVPDLFLKENLCGLQPMGYRQIAETINRHSGSEEAPHQP